MLVKARAAWHHAKLEELRGYLDEVRQTEGWERSERTLIAGLAYHEKMLELLDDIGDPGSHK